jgi:hypothetical protein
MEHPPKLFFILLIHKKAFGMYRILIFTLHADPDASVDISVADPGCK